MGGHLGRLIRTKTTTTTTNSLIDSDDWLLYEEILTRLPVKSLIRFKSVCKRWCSMIQKDQKFIDLHLTRSKARHLRRLFIVVPVPKTKAEIKREKELAGCFFLDNWPYKSFHVTADLVLFEDEGITKVVVDTVREVDSSSYNIISKPVNGLVCLIDSEDEYAVRICNISTGELSPWFESSLLSEKIEHNGVPVDRMCKNYSDTHSNYQFGFDPITNQHKLVCVWKVTTRADNRGDLICEVLTIGHRGVWGNNRWRRIDEVPPNGLANDSIYVNGVIYWGTNELANGEWETNGSPICIVAFDVGNEKFREIIVPDSILFQPRDDFEVSYHGHYGPYYTNFNGHANLLEVGGHLALLIRIKNRMFKMYTYEEDDYQLNEVGKPLTGSSGSSFSSNTSGRWSEVCSITLPFCLEENERLKFHTFVGSDDKIILTTQAVCRGELGKTKLVSFYCCNWKKDSWTKLELTGIPSSVPQLYTDKFFATYFETLLSVDNDNALS